MVVNRTTGVETTTLGHGGVTIRLRRFWHLGQTGQPTFYSTRRWRGSSARRDRIGFHRRKRFSMGDKTFDKEKDRREVFRRKFNIDPVASTLCAQTLDESSAPFL
jgi:hypothetical protein